MPFLSHSLATLRLRRKIKKKKNSSGEKYEEAEIGEKVKKFELL